MKRPTPASVIITTRNEAGHIGACIDSIRKQTYRPVEILVVDNGSTDETVKIATQKKAKIFRKGPERSAQRNYGAAMAAGDILLFIDADMTLEPDVVSQCKTELASSAIQAVVIPEESVGEGFWTSCKALERSFYFGVDWIEAARCYRREAFAKVGGFDEGLTGPEDFDLPQKIKETYGAEASGRITARIIHHEGRLTLSRTLSKKLYYGKKMHAYRTRIHNVKYLRKQSSLIRRYALFFSRPAVLLRDPVVSLGMLFMKTAEIGALALGYLAGIAEGS